MGCRIPLIVLLAALWSADATAEQWQVVLLKPTGCAACTFVEEMLKRSGQLREVVLEDGAGGQVGAQIVRRAGSDLEVQESRELAALPYYDADTWRRQAEARSAQVLLKRDGVVVAAGDIGDSADLRSVRLPPEITTPDLGRDPGAVRAAHSTFVSQQLLRSWNLDWFYRLAKDPQLARTRSDDAWIASATDTLPAPLEPANALVISTASGAADNEIFNALRIEEIRTSLTQWLGVDAAQIRVFYGDGNERGANALEVRDGRIGLVRRSVAGAMPFTPDAALRIFQSIRARPGSRNLMVLVGHGNPEGAGMWSSATALSPRTLRALHEHGGGDDVLVSGNCYGGIMARAMSCGFFGARPDIVATGCQADAAEVAQSRDYLHMFFSSLAPDTRHLVDTDGNGTISFAEAHWYASIEGDQRNVTYTSLDALADQWFEDHASAPRSLAVREIRALAVHADPAESQALERLLAGHEPDLPISLADLAGQSQQWIPGRAMPRAMLGQLARRLLYLAGAGAADPAAATLRSCENRSIGEFLAR